MNRFTFLYDLPIWLFILFFVGALLAALEGGYRVGLRKREALTEESSGGGHLVFSSMLALLGLMLAFTYGFTVSRADSRKQAVVAEANALGTAFLRAGLVVGPDGTELQRALLAYARTRIFSVETVGTRAQIAEAIERTLQAQARLWPATERIVQSKPFGPKEAALVAAIIEVLDLHTSRVTASVDRLPQFLLWTLVFIAMASLAVAGFNAGLTTGRMSRWRTTAFILSSCRRHVGDHRTRPHATRVHPHQPSEPPNHHRQHGSRPGHAMTGTQKPRLQALTDWPSRSARRKIYGRRS